MGHRVSRHRLVVRGVFAVLAAIWIAGLGLDGYHLAAVRHGLCSHGEVEEISSGNAAVVGDVEDASDGRASFLPATVEHHHHHCGALQRSGGRPLLRLVAARIAAKDASSAPLIVRRCSILLRQLPLYRLAPKNSPDA